MIYFYSIQKYHSLPKEVTQITYIELLSKIANLKKETLLALDCETTGLNPRANDVIMLQIGNIENQLVVDTRGMDIAIFRPLLELETITWVGHNIKFDYNMLKKSNIILGKVYDTMVAEMVLFNGRYSLEFLRKARRYSLRGVYKHHFDIEIVKDVALDFLSVGKGLFNMRQITYGALDVVYPLEIFRVQSV